MRTNPSRTTDIVTFTFHTSQTKTLLINHNFKPTFILSVAGKRVTPEAGATAAAA